MYRRKEFCQTLVEVDGDSEKCGEELGYSLCSHVDDRVLVTAKRACPRCKALGVNEAALFWERMPAASQYQGPTIYQMALEALRVHSAADFEAI